MQIPLWHILTMPTAQRETVIAIGPHYELVGIEDNGAFILRTTNDNTFHTILVFTNGKTEYYDFIGRLVK